uniref:Uncharacterized protein n=1 Tax=Setaria viridis TaxID=4556 RepID=A0A4U6W7S7_SETVI|nr:hypothetical protein SEVIR_1G119800v2 [Setaria viridis]
MALLLSPCPPGTKKISRWGFTSPGSGGGGGSSADELMSVGTWDSHKRVKSAVTVKMTEKSPGSSEEEKYVVPGKRPRWGFTSPRGAAAAGSSAHDRWDLHKRVRSSTEEGEEAECVMKSLSDEEKKACGVQTEKQSSSEECGVEDEQLYARPPGFLVAAPDPSELPMPTWLLLPRYIVD